MTNACRDIVKTARESEEIDDSDPRTHRDAEPDPTGDAAVDHLEHAARIDRARAGVESGVCRLVARERRAPHVAGVLRSHVSSCVALNPHPTSGSRCATRDFGLRSLLEGRLPDEHGVLKLTLRRSRGVPHRLAAFGDGIRAAVVDIERPVSDCLTTNGFRGLMRKAWSGSTIGCRGCAHGRGCAGGPPRGRPRGRCA